MPISIRRGKGTRGEDIVRGSDGIWRSLDTGEPVVRTTGVTGALQSVGVLDEAGEPTTLGYVAGLSLLVGVAGLGVTVLR